MQKLDLDVTEAADSTSNDVVLHGSTDVASLKAAGFRYSVEIPDLGAAAAKAARQDQAYAASTARSALPTGRTSYRRLYDYDFEMKELARRHSDLVRLDVLAKRTIKGRDISAVEITQHAQNTADGKPIFLDMGLLHAREWPSGELPMEFGYDLINSFGHNARITALLRKTRLIILPVANPDGFSVSRQAASLGDFSTFD